MNSLEEQLKKIQSTIQGMNGNIYRAGSAPHKTIESSKQLAQQTSDWGNKFSNFLVESGKRFTDKTMEVLNPGSSYIQPTLEKRGVSPLVAGGIGLGLDILAPGPGELSKVKKFTGLKDLSTKLLEKFRDMPEEITPQQFNEVINKATKEGIRKADLDLIKEMTERQSKTNAVLPEIPNAPKGGEYTVFSGSNEKGTRIYERFSSKSDAKKYVSDLQKKGGEQITIDVFDADNDLLSSVNVKTEIGKISLPQLAKDVQIQLVPLTSTPVKSPRWSNVGEDFIGDGKYGEIVYQSPIKTSAGDVHFGGVTTNYAGGRKVSGGKDFPNYFSHIRYEDMADGKTRKILETQSDLMQKENFARELPDIAEKVKVGNREFEVVRNRFGKDETTPKMFSDFQMDDAVSKTDMASGNGVGVTALDGKGMTREEAMKAAQEAQKILEKRKTELSGISNYESNDPLAHLRTFREEVKRAAKDGKDTLLIPSGDTAMKIEGLGENAQKFDRFPRFNGDELKALTIEDMKVGDKIRTSRSNDYDWVITNILGEGKFKAVPKEQWNLVKKGVLKESVVRSRMEETFDISGKVDTKHFVYKLNEEAIPREARKMRLVVEGKIKQDNGEWWKINIPKERAKMPVEAFGVLPFLFPQGRKEEEKKQLFPLK